MGKREAVEIEVLINGQMVALNKNVPIQTLKNRPCAHLEIKDCKPPSVGTLEVWVREVRK